MTTETTIWDREPVVGERIGLTAIHQFKLYTYPDGTTREILDGRLGRNGKWYAFPVCDECGARKSAKVHAALKTPTTKSPVESRATIVCRQEKHPAHRTPCQKWIDNGWTGHGCHCEGHA